MHTINRKQFVGNMAMLCGMVALPEIAFGGQSRFAKSGMKLGLCTYLWGKDWDIPTLIKNCTTAEIYGVELRVDHAHKVMPDLSAGQRKEVKKQFGDSDIKIVGLGTNEQFDSPDPEKLKKSIERTKEFIRLSADIGGSGVKVKPNALHKEVATEKTLAQIGQSLDELARYAKGFGQQIRLEVHGEKTQEIQNIKTIMDNSADKNATVCWNCNPQDLNGQGLEYNFNLLKSRFGDTVHVRELNNSSYPYRQLMNLFVKNKYKGWILLECGTNPADKVAALIEQNQIFKEMIG